MRQAACHLRRLGIARERVTQVIDGPDPEIDRIIRSLREHGGQVSNKLVMEFRILKDGAVASAVSAAARRYGRRSTRVEPLRVAFNR